MQVTSDRVELTGGPVWHVRALRRRGRLWAPFRAQVKDWLGTWQLATREIILVGPSAGWCLPDSFLSRFDKILAVDPDRSARFLFLLAHGAAARRTTWLHADFFVDCESILAAHPEAAILFCNVAGQRRYVLPDVDLVEAEMARVKVTLAGRPWASFHDLLSSQGAPEYVARDYEGRQAHAVILQDSNLSGRWLDHLTGELLPENAARKILPWRFGPERFHLVEAGIVSA